MDRRDFLKYSSLITAAGVLPELAFAGANPQQRQDKILVLVELKGGNDGFNTLVPYKDDYYKKYRPNLALKESTLIKLGEGKGKGKAMSPSLKALASLWDDGQMAWIEGVGYPDGILSHFRSIDVWETASSANQVLDNGWLSRVLPRYKKGLHGIALSTGQISLGPLDATNLNCVTMQNPTSFLRQSRYVKDVDISHQTAALAHITNKQHQLHDVGAQIADKVGRGGSRYRANFAKGKLGHSLQSVTEMILCGVEAPVYKVTQEGFDTHANQLGVQNNALYQLAKGLKTFATAMKKNNMWDKVLVVTYSEFGRRAKENKSLGTDHGTASAHMVLGGKVRGGVYGKHPNLARLDDNGNVYHTTDFRAIYNTIGQRWWGQQTPWKGYGTIPFI